VNDVQTSRPLSLVATLFFLSGASALIYQVLWLRLLGTVFGTSVHAATTVLASFMGGLAIGSFAAGRLAARVRFPLRWFGAAEVLIAISALATPAALEILTRLYVAVHPMVAGNMPALTALRFVGASAVLLVPTTLMGASLPLVLQSSVRRDSAVASRFAVLYAVNTSGAIAGVLLVGFVLIEQIGVLGAFRLAAAINLIVGLTAVAISVLTAMDAIVPSVPAAAHALPASREDRLVLAVFAISGFSALALEIAWFRLLVLFVNATTYAFTTMLAAVLFGIAAGSFLAPIVMQRATDERRALAIVELAIGFAAMLALIALTRTYQAGWRTSNVIQASLLAIAPAMLLMGVAFPLGVRLFTREHDAAPDTAAQRVATLYAVNVGAAIVGAVAAGFLLIPVAGGATTLVVVSALSTSAGLVLLAFGNRRPWITATLVVVAFAGVVWFVPDPVSAVIMRRYSAAERLEWREEGAQSTVSVHVRDAGHRVLYLDGLHQANDSPEMVHLHRQIGHLPMALHPKPHRALVVGLGAGATAGAVQRHRGVEVTLIELSPSVVRASRLFDHINGAVVTRPNVRLSINDARNHLLLTSERYDVITADIIQPFHAGAGNLYSREYFMLVREALRDEGLTLQWIGHRADMQYRLIMRTFLDVFPHATLWADGALMVGSRRPLRIDTTAFAARLDDGPTRDALSDVGLASVEALLASYTAGPEEMRAFAGTGPILTDDRPLLEYFGALPRDDRQVDLRNLRGDVRRHVAR
jgi:spermidine synthase